MPLDADPQHPASQTIVVAGGGIAGISAALEAAETGHDVVLIEKGPSLGGRVTRLNSYFPMLCHPTLCQTNVEMHQDQINKQFGTDYNIPVVFYSQLMAVAFGMDAEKDAALQRNTIEAPKLARWRRRSSQRLLGERRSGCCLQGRGTAGHEVRQVRARRRNRR